MLALGMKLPGLAARAAAVGALPSLGLLTLAGMLPKGWTASFHEVPSPCDATARAALTQQIAETNPTLAAISTMTASAHDAYALADALRACGIRVAFGGLHASMEPRATLQHSDSVCIGEGEPVWHAMLRDASCGKLQPTYRASDLGAFQLADAPLPDWSLIAKDGLTTRPRFTLQTSRGCPFACDFCGASRLLGSFREKPVHRIKAELEAITRIKPRAAIELADDNTFAGKRSAAELCGVLRDSGVRWFTECDWRIGERPDVLRELASSGCVQVLVGVESLTTHYDGFGAKRAPLPRVMDALRRVQDAGVAVIGCFVVGGDDDTLSTMHELGEWLTTCELADIQITLQTPFPGTPLRARLAAEGRLLSNRSWDACTLFDVAYQPANMSVAELERGFRNVVGMVHAPELAAKRDDLRRQIWGRRYAAVQTQ
jgi:radical SAM superfamily enzyme YgiQ (UPF0313 family)